MKKAILLAMLFVSFLAQSQVVELWRRPIFADCVQVDRLGNIYTIHNNIVTKYDENLNVQCSYDNYAAGNISLLDVTNPFKIIVFYAEFNKSVYLDNNLSLLQSAINLDDAGFYNTTSVASSSFGGFWLFDEQEMCVRRLESDLSTSVQGTNIYAKLGDSNVVYIKESANYIFLLTSKSAIIVLDKFANYFTTIELEAECSDFCTDNDILYCNSAKGIQVFDLTRQTQTEIEVPYSTKIFSVRQGKLFVVCDNMLICSELSR